MATMVKEKRREKKKKPKDVPVLNITKEAESPSSVPCVGNCKNKSIPSIVEEDSTPCLSESNFGVGTSVSVENPSNPQTTLPNEQNLQSCSNESITVKNEVLVQTTQSEEHKILENVVTYIDLHSQLDRLNISYDTTASSFEIETGVEAPADLSSEMEPSDVGLKEQIDANAVDSPIEDDVCPSAPVFDEILPNAEIPYVDETIKARAWENIPKVQCMPLAEAARLFGGEEINKVKAMSEKEEAIVEAGPMCGPEHPLVDLLSNFRCSLIAVVRERTNLARGFVDEEKSRSKLWKIEKRTAYVSENCSCGSSVALTVAYEHAELMKSQLPVAKMRLESLLRDAQHSYCHHQHAALLAHCQIEDLIAETIQTGKNNIREALSLILKELRMSDSGPSVLSEALQRWARALSEALIDGRDLRQLLFLLHHMCRQTRSVSWVASLVNLSASDSIEVARVLGLLDLLMAGTRIDPALECTEETDEVWEEVDKRGASGAVADGALREKDLLSLFHAFPLSDIVARLALFRHRDINQANEYEWGDGSGGRGVLKSACGTRVLLSTLHKAVASHPRYERLARAMIKFALQVVFALADLHLHTRDYYAKELEAQIIAEIEATFSSTWALLSLARMNIRLPFRMLERTTAMLYCVPCMVMLHESETRPIDGTSVELQDYVTCEERVRLVTHACVDRTEDYDLANNVLEFLFEVGLKRKPTPCKGGCEAAARECLPKLLEAHPYLYTMAFHSLVDLCQAENTDPSVVTHLSPEQWRPTPQEAVQVLSECCSAPTLLPAILTRVDCTPHVGLSLDTQLAIGSWLTIYNHNISANPEWPWSILRRLRLHRAWWNMPYDAALPHADGGLLQDAFNLLAGTTGHCVPLICEYGVKALLRLAQAGRLRDVTHCLSGILIVMTQSPESVSFTPKFGELFSLLLGAGPNLIQRALGRGGDSGSNLLLKLMITHLTDTCHMVNIPQPTILSTWLHSLWKHGCPLLEVGMLACRQWQHLDRFAAAALQEENAKEHINSVLRTSSQHPTIACSILRAMHAQQDASGLWGRVLHALHCQLIAKKGIHVDNALKTIGAPITSEELVIHKVAAAALVAPLSNPSHLSLWNIFFCLYLQRPPTDLRESTAPVGPLIFSGYTKSRVLNQLKKRLFDTATYHYNESTRLKTEQKQTPSESPSIKIAKSEPGGSKSSKLDSDLLPSLSLTDLTGEIKKISDSSGSDSDKVEEEVKIEDTADRQLQDLIMYHVVAESLIRTYIGWLEEGDKVRALPHTIRQIPEPAVTAACRAELTRLLPPSSPDDEDLVPFPKGVVRVTPSVKTPFQRVVERLTKYRPKVRRRRRRTSLKSPLEDMNLNNPRTLLSLVDKYLTDIERLVQDWENEVSRLSKLDSALWELVASLRVCRTLPPVKKRCPNKCPPVTLVVPGHSQEWCVSRGAEQGIQDNRASARTALRKLARPRPSAAKTAAALQTITRQVRSPETATSILDRVWRCSSNKHAEDCAPARLLLSNIVTDLAEKWITHDGVRCADFFHRWCTSSKDFCPLKQSLAGALLSPRRLQPGDWTSVYTTILKVDIPAHAAFSYLSKFEINRWSEVASSDQRRAALEALTVAAQRHGAKPDKDYSVLLELLGVHTATLLDAREVSNVLLRCARASVENKLPATHWSHVQRAVDAIAETVSSDQLGHTLRELGVIWWGARTHTNKDYSSYAPHMAKLLRTLIFAFVSALQNQHYASERVAWFAWSALQEAWSPWILPCVERVPLLPSAGDVDTFVLQQFCRDTSGLIHACVGSEPHILQEVFEWVNLLFPTTSPQWSQDERAKLSCLLVELRNLPWNEHQWFGCRCMPSLVKLCASDDKEAQSWSCEVLHKSAAVTWLQGVPDDHLAPHLATLFYLFTTMSLHVETLDEATKLPWWRLPSAALEPALERFFMERHNIATAYHTVNQFRIVIFASELSFHPTINVYFNRPGAHEKRLSATSLWVRAMSSPTLQGHVADGTRELLDVITNIGPSLSSTEGVVEALLSRAVIILCTEPAGATSLPVWEKWVSCAPAALVRSCLSAVATLTMYEHYAALADATVKAHLLASDSTGWSEVVARWQDGHWRDAHLLAARGRLHAAYATCVTHAQASRSVRTALMALLALEINFVESEPIIALWICYACRVARQSDRETTDDAASTEAVLQAWGEAKRISILKAITMQASTDQPTHKLRLLCRFAKCVLSPESENAVRAFEACIPAAMGSNPGDIAAWGMTPHPRRLPRLAMRLFPKFERYFQLEYDMTPEEN